MQLLAGIGPLGVPELLIIAFIVILVFGVGRLPEVGGAVGRGIREFRKAAKDDGDEAKSGDSGSGDGGTMAAVEPPASATVNEVFCGECGTKNLAGNKFCASCGKELHAPVS